MKQCITLASLFCILLSFSQTNRIDSLTVKLAYQKQDSAKVETALYLVNELFNANEYRKALVYIEQTEKLSKTLNYKSATADILYFKGLIYSNNNDYYNAVDSFTKALTNYESLNDNIGIAKVKNRIGILEINRGNFEIGLKNSSSAITVFESNNLAEELSSAYNNLAEAYSNIKEIDKALEFNLKALRVRTDLRDTIGIINTSEKLGNIYAKRKEHRQAIRYYESLLKLSIATKDRNLRGAVLPRLGNEYLQLNDLDKAADYLVDGLKLNRRLKNETGVLRALNAVSQLNLNEGNDKLARIQANEANAIAKRIDDKEQLLENYRLQKEIDSIKKNFQNAFFWQGKYYELKQEIEDEDKLERKPKFSPIINDSNASREQPSESQDKPIENEVRESTGEEDSFALYVLSSILLVAVIIIVLLILYRKRDNVDAFQPPIEDNQELILERENLLEKNKEYAARIVNLEEVNGIKDRLFSIVSHDLKDSVSSIKAFIDLIKDGNISKKEFKNLIPELSENADNAMELLFNLLNWSKSQMQNLEPKPENFNIQEIFSNKLSLIEQKAQRKNVQLFDKSHRDFIYADKSMVEIIVQNLLTNAVKFTKDGDTITVSNSDNYGKALISVADTGVGISEANVQKLFNDDDFTTSGTSNEQGTGLGLTICKQLVELNNGKIWVESQVDVGTTFYVELPKTQGRS